jgi:hypothetical protein
MLLKTNTRMIEFASMSNESWHTQLGDGKFPQQALQLQEQELDEQR